MRINILTAIGAAGLTAAALVGATAAPQQALAATTVAATAAQAPVKAQIHTGARTAILEMANKSGSKDSQYLAQGRFRFAGITCQRCELGPAVAAAALYSRTGDPKMKAIAVTVFDRAIKDQVRPDGSFSKGAGQAESGNGIQTIFFAEHLGATLTYLGKSLDSNRRAVWIRAQKRAVDHLIADGWLSFYSNGNLNLATTVAIGMTAKLTGGAKYKAAYEKSQKFTMKPGKGRFAQYGLKITKQGSRALGRDSRAYFAENGAAGVGFDPDYTMFQADIAAQGYQTLGDQRLLTVLNMLNNQLLTRTDTTDWSLDISGGTRHPGVTGKDAYQSPALLISALNGRPELKSLAYSQLNRVATIMHVSSIFPFPGMYQAWGTRFAVQIAAI